MTFGDVLATRSRQFQLRSLESLDATHAAAFGPSSDPERSQALEHEGDWAAMRHHLRSREGRGLKVQEGKEDLLHRPPSGTTLVVPRFKDDLAALLKLSNFDLPPLRVVRPAKVVHVFCGFADASGK